MVETRRLAFESDFYRKGASRGKNRGEDLHHICRSADGTHRALRSGEFPLGQRRTATGARYGHDRVSDLAADHARVAENIVQAALFIVECREDVADTCRERVQTLAEVAR